MKQRKRIGSLRAVTALLTLSFTAIWAVCMYCMTSATAESLLHIFYDRNKEFGTQAVAWNRLSEALESGDQTPGQLEYAMWQILNQRNSSSYSMDALETGRSNVLRGEALPFQTAVAIYDAQGKPVETSCDFVYFPYVTEELWARSQEETEVSGYAKVVLSGNMRTLFSNFKSAMWFDVRAMRLTGVLRGAELVPSKIEYVTWNDFNDALDRTEPAEQGVDEAGTPYKTYEYSVSQVIREQNISWRPVYEAEPSGTGEEVTLYTTYPQMMLYDRGSPVRFRGAEYENLAAVLSQVGPKLAMEYDVYDQIDLGESVVFGQNYLFDSEGFTPTEEQLSPPMKYAIVIAVRSTPWRSAMSELRTVYVITFALAALCVLVLRSALRRCLIRPLEQANAGISGGWARIPAQEYKPRLWRETEELNGHYEDTQDKLRMNKNEITRLNTALDYAQKAEQNRRQMTSNIAHELKTPLAVIHSYAEGLQERIAEEKREQYLSVILSEAERMDGMVLEMLDLSRLEAGKVKLARDEFSLSALAKSVFDRLSLAAKGKQLLVDLDLDGDCLITADEGRIEQVITNFAANAIKYTPQDGKIRVKTRLRGGIAHLTVENDGEPLTGEALNKLWDSFYRADSARGGEGTGLGLAICKSIIELHGGKCLAQNTKTGVEIGFTIKS